MPLILITYSALKVVKSRVSECISALGLYGEACDSSVFVFVSSSAVRTKSSSVGLSDWASAADQPSV